MYNDPNQPQQPPYGQPPSGQPQWGPPPQQPPYEQPQTQWGPPPQQPPYGQPQWSPPPEQYGQPPYGAPQYGVPPAQPPKRSLRWLWITLGIVGGIILLSCIGCGILFATGFSLIKNTVQPAVIATQYYQALQQHDYTKAYSYLDPNITAQGGALTQNLFTQGAQAAEALKGPISSYTPSSTNVNNNTANITMTVTRNNSSYSVQLTLKQEGNDWKITRIVGPLGLY